jgi:hypothetical protein
MWQLRLAWILDAIRSKVSFRSSEPVDIVRAKRESASQLNDEIDRCVGADLIKLFRVPSLSAWLVSALFSHLPVATQYGREMPTPDLKFFTPAGFGTSVTPQGMRPGDESHNLKCQSCQYAAKWSMRIAIIWPESG